MAFVRSAAVLVVNSINREMRRANFNILMLKRISSSQSFAGKIVFPGGTLDECDYSEKWQPIIDRHFSKSQLDNVAGKSDLSIYEDSKSLSSCLRPEIFYRLCAIRETFEETGILLARDGSKKSTISDGNLLQDIKSHNWQDKVSRRSGLFLDMCVAYGISPDLLSLTEWSEWLGPPQMKRRFNTVFFMTVVHEVLTPIINRGEYEDFSWKTPKDALDDHFDKNEFAPPQIAELSDLLHLPSWQHLEQEAARRSLQKIIRNIGSLIQLSNGRIIVFSGDSRCGLAGSGDEIAEFRDKRVEDLQSDRRKRRVIYQDGKVRYENNLGELLKDGVF